jgi:hydrogenase maturation protein HypF
VAVKGLGGFHLLVRRAQRGGRRAAAHAQAATGEAARPDGARRRGRARALRGLGGRGALLSGREAPIVLLQRRDDARLAAEIAPGNPRVGLMLPTTPLHHLLMAEVDAPLVATSGNLSDEPIAFDDTEALNGSAASPISS